MRADRMRIAPRRTTVPEAVVSKPTPRPKLPRTLCAGAHRGRRRDHRPRQVREHDEAKNARVTVRRRGRKRRLLARPRDPRQSCRRDENRQRPRLRVVVWPRRRPENGQRDPEEHGSQAGEHHRVPRAGRPSRPRGRGGAGAAAAPRRLSASDQRRRHGPPSALRTGSHPRTTQPVSGPMIALPRDAPAGNHIGRANVRTGIGHLTAGHDVAWTVRRGAVPHPPVIPRAKSCSIHAANGLFTGTSAKIPVAAGGVCPARASTGAEYGHLITGHALVRTERSAACRTRP